MTTPMTMAAKDVRMGTRRRPAKKPSQSGRVVRWKRCLEDIGQDQEADDGGQRRGPVALLGETEGNADGEEQGKVFKQGATGCADDLGDGGQRLEPAQQVVLAEAQEERSRWQGGDREHKAAAEALHVLEGFAAAFGLVRGWRGQRTGRGSGSVFRGHDVPRFEEGCACAGVWDSVESC